MMKRLLLVLALALVFVLGVAVGIEAQEEDEQPAPLPAGERYQPAQTELELAQVYENVIQSVVHVSVVTAASPRGTGAGNGSGFVIDAEGHIVTNNHVAEGASYIEVTFVSGARAKAELVGNDPDSDLAVIKVDPAGLDLQPVVLADSEQTFVGQEVMAIGSPFGQDFTLTTGIVSALDRNLETDDRFSIPDIIQTDAAINPGNSGGPLLDFSGQVLGVNTAILSGGQSASGVGFAVPANTVRRVAPYLIEQGEYQHVWLGITGSTLLAEQREHMELDADVQGIMVAEVIGGGPAAQAGLSGVTDAIEVPFGTLGINGDIITAIEGTSITEMNDLIAYLEANTRPGDTVTLNIIRDDTEQTIDVQLQTRP